VGELVNSLRDGGTVVGYVFNATVKVHRGQVMRKMPARSLAELVRMADKLKLSRPQSKAS
jgi:hypothetical protein